MPAIKGGFAPITAGAVVFVGDGLLEVSGLRNVGNTCFINAVLQSLASLPPFVTYLKTLRPAGAEAQRPFTNELLHLMQRLSPERLGSSRPIRPIPSPGVLKDLLSKKVQRFAGFDQQDAQELFQMVMDIVRQEAVVKLDRNEGGNRANHSTAGLRDLFWPDNLSEVGMEETKPAVVDQATPVPANPMCGELASRLCCTKCKNASTTMEPFHDLSLTLPQARGVSERQQIGKVDPVKLDEILDDYTKEQCLPSVECLGCGRGTPKKHPHSKAMSLGKLPETLCLHIPRRHQSPYGSMMKLEQQVEFPLELDVAKYCYTGCTLKIEARPKVSCAGVSAGPTKQGQGFPRASPFPAKTPSAVPRMSRSPSTPNGSKLTLRGGNATATPILKDGGRKRMNDFTPRGTRGRGEGVADIVGGNVSTAEGGTRKGDKTYDLRAVIVHEGGADGADRGHYTAFRNLSSSDDGAWVSLSDETVKRVNVEEVLRSQAYMLFYRRRAQTCRGLG